MSHRVPRRIPGRLPSSHQPQQSSLLGKRSRPAATSSSSSSSSSVRAKRRRTRTESSSRTPDSDSSSFHLDLAQTCEYLASDELDDVKQALFLLLDEPLSSAQLNDPSYYLGDVVNRFRGHADPLIAKYAFDLVSSWRKRGVEIVPKPAAATPGAIKLTVREAYDVFASTGERMRDYAIATLLTDLVKSCGLSSGFTLEHAVAKAKMIELAIGSLGTPSSSSSSSSSSGNARQYKRKLVELHSNLGRESNSELRISVLSGRVSPATLVGMSPSELAGTAKAREREQLRDAKFHSKRQYEQGEVSDGMYTCFKCRKSKCTVYSMQTRSGDEPMTQFICCVTCGNRWRQ